jgi:Zn-dependent peptidase ImmA (M78 family)
MGYIWKSQLVKSLMVSTNTQSPSQAIINLIDQKLKILGKIEPPVNLEMVASICDIQPKFIVTKMDEDGRLVSNDNKWYIYLNTDHYISRQRFSAGHEITHKIIHAGTPIGFSCEAIGDYARRHEEEWLCDFGSSHLLLMQRQFLHPIICDMGCGFICIEHIKKLFGVSFEASARSITQFSPEPMAVAYYKLGYTQEENAKRQQLILLPDYVPAFFPKMRLAKYYSSIGFSVKFAKNKSVEEHNIIHQAFASDAILQADEIMTFDGRAYFQVSIEARKQTFFNDGERTEGVIAIITNPEFQIP